MAGWLGKARRMVEGFFDTLFPKSRVIVSPAMRTRLEEHPVQVIDVGGAMGPDTRWNPLRPTLSRFMIFEPDARSQDEIADASGSGDLTLPVGLADEAGERKLYLTRGPFASSLYKPNEDVLRNFSVWTWYEPAGEACIQVDTLDACIARHPAWRADFIKVDVEGANLDVLKGAPCTLEQAFGVQIEVSFMARNHGAPLQPEVDAWLRDVGFTPHQLVQERWVRANGVFGALSQPQIAWADAVYFRSREWVLERLASNASTKEAADRLTSIVALLLVYGAHDYAAELVSAARQKCLVDTIAADDLDTSIKRSVMTLTPFTIRGIVALTFAMLLAVPLLILGARGSSVGRSLVAEQAGPLFHALARAARRGGPDGGALL